MRSAEVGETPPASAERVPADVAAMPCPPESAPADRRAARAAAAAPQPPSSRLSEAQLSSLWRGRRFPAGALVTRHGVPVAVIHQGRPGRGPGPDFRNASICGPSGLPLHGDIELHVRSSSFHAHGHDRDAAYRNVILHVVFEDDTGRDTPLFGGGSAPVVALAPWVARRAEELQRWLAQPLLWREPCHDAVMRLGADGAGRALDAEGVRRFDARVARLRQTVSAAGLDQALYEGLLEAMGYGGNAPQMLALARLLPWDGLVSGRRERPRAGAGDRSRQAAGGGDGLVTDAAPEIDVAPSAAIEGASERWQAGAEALLLGSAGLLPAQRGHRGPVEAHVEELGRAFAAARLPSLPQGAWKLWGVRPENAPARRVAAAAALLARLGAPSALLAVLSASRVSDALAPLTVSASGYWRRHHDVCAGPARLPAAFIGRSRALEILINVVLPAAVAGGDPAAAAQARALYARLPRPATYGVTRFIEAALASEGVRVPVNARRAQGLLALHRDWCSQNGCGRCPLS